MPKELVETNETSEATESTESPIKNAIEAVVDKVKGIQEVELVDSHAGTHTIFTLFGPVEFEKGTAKAKNETAKHLKELGLIK